MSESDWATSTAPQAMLAFLQSRGPVSERKLRFYTCACCRSVWSLLGDERSREAVGSSERYADGAATGDEVGAASFRAEAVVLTLDFRADDSRHRLEQRLVRAGWMADDDTTGTIPSVTEDVRRAARSAEWATYSGTEYVEQGDQLVQSPHFFRDIFGNPFAPIAFQPEWRTEAVVALARGIYAERAFERMSVLGDALEEAGAGPELVRHCREPGTHVGGCHVLDAALDQS